jgi:vancomycin permeability regulator SanA
MSEHDDLITTLFRRDEPEPAELAIVLGHAEPRVSTWRAEHAAGLLLRGLVPALLLSGGRTAMPESEAGLMARACVDAGVPRDRLLLEEESRTTFENAARSLDLLLREARLDGIRTVLLVSCPWHMRRALLTMRGAFPARIRFLCCPHDRGCTRSTWRDSADCVTRVATECELLRRFLDAGLLRE